MDYLWTPWRASYMRDKKARTGCLFCQAAASAADEKTLVVHRAKRSFVILNRYPYTAGHLMVAPYEHAARMQEVDEESLEEMMRVLRFAEKALEELYRPEGLNLGMNLGEAAGAGIEQHIHMHLLPRWKGDANFMTTVANSRIIPEALEDTYARVKKIFAGRID